MDNAALSSRSKQIAKWALDQVAQNAAALGEASIALERMIYDQPTIGEILDDVSTERVRQSLTQIERKLATLPPGDPNVPRLLRARESFRVLLRAKQTSA